ncbi:uncharacterized protein LOC141627610 [Silene latifolia]|uniref:uncharacterized protein LOC141627610 n=1 Tax=Silene latifolia TaxID=37657 RepID=UPI003D78408C
MHPCTTFEEVQSKAIAVMRLEEDSAPIRGTYDSDPVSRKAPVEKKSERSKPYSRSVNKVSGNAEGKSEADLPPKVSEYGFTTNLAGLFKALKELGRRVRWPKLPEGNPSSRDTGKKCEFHGSNTHNTDECHSLRKEVKFHYDQGNLDHLLPVNTTDSKFGGSSYPPPPPHCSRTVNVITVDRSQSGLTYSVAKRHATRTKETGVKLLRGQPPRPPSVTFDETDAGSTPEQHHDALIITLPIGNCKVKKILVDTGSSVNLIMMETLKGMGFTEKDLTKKAIPLVGFSGETKHSLGEIIIPTYAGGVNRQALDPRDESNSLNVPPMPEQLQSQRIQDEYIEPQQAELDEVILDSLHPERTVLIGSECRGKIREVKYPEWLSNVVVVPKKNGKWRVCVDFTDLNKACPKDPFPLPHIDAMVDATAQPRDATFPDAWSGYNRIKMHPSDQEKTAFRSERGSTYQRLVNMMFKEQIGKTMEVYIDDMVVKSKQASQHHQHLEETFNTLRKYQMKLNPTKCTFGVSSGKFLGYMVTQRGIEASTEQIRAILQLESPQKPKDVQRLTGRVAALNRFISRSSDRYTSLEKLVLALVTASYKLRPYFESHTISVITNYPLKTIMRKPELSGRMAKWSVHLSGYDLKFEPRTAIKSRALADFVSDCLRLGTPDRTRHPESGGRQRRTARDPRMMAYLDVAKELKVKFVTFNIKQIPREQNAEADALATLGATFKTELFPQYQSSTSLEPKNTKISKEAKKKSTPRNPQSNGQAESSNKIIIENLKKKLEEIGGKWAEELPLVLWADRTTPKVATGQTPFSLVFGAEAVIPSEVRVPTHRYGCIIEDRNQVEMASSLDTIDELRTSAQIRMASYRQTVAKSYNKNVKVRTLQVGDLVLRKVFQNTKNQQAGKFAYNWEGPYQVESSVGNGAYRLMTMEGYLLSLNVFWL